MELCVGKVFCDYSMLFTLYKIGEVYFRLLSTSDFHIKAKKERLLLRAHVVVKISNMNNLCLRLADYVKKLQRRACRTYSTIIFHHSANQIIDFYISRVFSKVRSVLSPCNTRLRLVRLLRDIEGIHRIPIRVWSPFISHNSAPLSFSRSLCESNYSSLSTVFNFQVNFNVSLGGVRWQS